MEDYLPEFIHNMGVCFEEEKQSRIESELKRKEEERLIQVAELEIQKKQGEERKINMLLNMCTGLSTSKSISDLISEVRFIYGEVLVQNDKLKTWLEWAENIKDRLNPIKTIEFLNKYEK